jgi:hypothetical protein
MSVPARTHQAPQTSSCPEGPCAATRAGVHNGKLKFCLALNYAFAARQRAQNTGEDGERQYASAVETADDSGCPVCRNVPGVIF